MLPSQPEQLPYQLPRGGPYGLIGRRGEVLELERRFAESNVVLLTGDVGVGKSELALGFASWMQKTGGRPGGVFFTSFDAGAGLDKVLHETGTAVAGLDFGDLRAAERRRWLLDYLRENDALLVWDRLENLAGFPGRRTRYPGRIGTGGTERLLDGGRRDRPDLGAAGQPPAGVLAVLSPLGVPRGRA